MFLIAHVAVAGVGVIAIAALVLGLLGAAVSGSILEVGQSREPKKKNGWGSGFVGLFSWCFLLVSIFLIGVGGYCLCALLY